jgi:hypothetical protein
VLNNASQISQCVVCTIPYCSSCNSTNVCGLCYVGYIPSNGTCVSNVLVQLNCQLPCTQCSINGQCSQCLYAMYSSLPNNGTCFMCNVANCYICSYSNPSNCTQCLQNYTVVQGNLGGYCQLISSYGCFNISAITGSCIQCNSYFSLQNNGSCLQCSTSIQGCTACSTNLTTCTACQSGMYLLDNTCFLCSVFCSTCNSTTCITQNPQVYIANNQPIISPCYMPCISCSSASPTICLACTYGYMLQNNTCVICGASSGCKFCGSASQCQACYNYQLLNSLFICMPCSGNCQSCSISQSNCTSCLNNYLLVNNTCVSEIVPSTIYCASWTVNACSLCLSGFVLVNVGNNCVSSPNCPSPYYNCFPAMPGCFIFAAGNPLVCEYCDAGLTLNPYNNSCMQCPQNCQNCSLDGVCSQCLAGYYLTGNNVTACAPNCQYPCATCSFTNGSICLSCVNGYTFSALTNFQCSVNDIGCTPCNACPGGYGLNASGSCIPCNASLYCLNCARSTPNKCISCRVGYFLNSSFACSACPTNCSICTSYTTCTACMPGSYSPQTYNSNL